MIVATVLALCCGTAARAGDGRDVVAFGDSLSDMGNRWLSTKKPDIKFRQTWVARLAGPQMLGMADFKPSGTTTYYGGTNYAVGGAGTAFTAKMGPDRNGTENLTVQVTDRYLNPEFNTDGVRRDALHVIVIGANDLMLASVGFDQILSQWAKLDNAGVSVAQSTEGQIQALASAGVTRVLWGNVFDVAQAPAVSARAKALGTVLTPTYLAALTKAVAAHNTEMDAAIARLHKANPSLRITKLDLYARFAEVAADPKKFGFDDVTTGANDARHLFSADGLHPTPQGHQMVADYAFAVLSGKN